MRALWLTSSYPRSTEDHAGIFLHRWARGLVRRGVAVRVLAPGAPDAPAREMLDGVEVVRFSYFWPRWKQRLAYGRAGLMVGLKDSPLAQAQLPTFAASLFWNTLRECGDADALHAFWTPMGAVALAVRQLRRRPVVLSPLGTDLRSLPRSFNRVVVAGAQAIVAGGGAGTEVHDRLATMTRKPLHPIFLPIDEAGLDAADGEAFRNELGLKREPVVTFIARMYEQKDPWTFLDAAPLILAKRPRTRFVMVGDGPLLPLLREGAKARGIWDSTFLTGARNDVGAILKASNVFVSLNLLDNCWATTIAEAMHLGVPCVVSDGGQERKLFPDGDAALLVPQEDPAALAGAVLRILSKRDLTARLAEGGRGLLAAHRRQDDLIVEDTINLYQSVTNGH
ncbi:MAG: glycosyltransferase [Deltaproteobacteria bacterium]|nr:glycosyltransferase [Deltaproteobacteria bacterium]